MADLRRGEVTLHYEKQYPQTREVTGNNICTLLKGHLSINGYQENILNHTPTTCRPESRNKTMPWVCVWPSSRSVYLEKHQRSNRLSK